MTLPRDILTGKMPRVYDSILSLGGVLIPMQQDMAGNVLAYYPDGSTLAGTPAPGVAFDPDGKIPRVVGGSPVATFDDTGDNITFPVPAGDRLTMSGGGTFLCCVTPGFSPETWRIFMVANVVGIPWGSYYLYATGGNALRVLTQDTTSLLLLQTSDNVFADGERFVFGLTVTPQGIGTISKNGQPLKTGPLKIPANRDSILEIGNQVAEDWPAHSVVDYVATIEGVVLDAPELQAIAAQSGPLG